jgi:hypothetical protein
MLNQKTSTAASGEGTKYQTRYGMMTAEQAGTDLLVRSWERLHFLKEVLAAVGHSGADITLKVDSSFGLVAILQDIFIDVYTAQAFYNGDESEPGKLG